MRNLIAGYRCGWIYAWVCACVYASIGLGCQASTRADGSPTAMTQGVIMNSCGPADGPETRVLLSDHSLDCSAPKLPYLIARVEGFNLTGISVGKGQLYLDSIPQRCDSAGCLNAGPIKFQFLDSSSQGYRIQFEIEKDGKTDSRGTVLLKTCDIMIKCG